MSADQTQEIRGLISRQAKAAGINPAVAIRIAETESSLNPNAKNKRSSAYGLYQLTDARRRELGIPVGKPMTVEEQVDAGIKSLLNSQEFLERKLGREPQAHELYAAHFSGHTGSLRLLTADPNKQVSQVLSKKAARANPNVMGLTVGQQMEQWKDKLGEVGPVRLRQEPRTADPGNVPSPEGSPMDFLNDPSYQLWAQQNAPQESQEPVAFMAEGGEVGDDEGLAQMIDAAKSDEDYRRINEVIAAKKSGVQGMAAGGVPFSPVARITPSARAQLEAIKADYDRYNAAVPVYNAALEKYQTEVYEPYSKAVDEYNAAVEAYNAGTDTSTRPWTLKGAGSNAQGRFGNRNAGEEFSAVEPTAPADFSMAAPVAPSVSQAQYEQMAADAKKSAARRQMALVVASDPERFGLSMNKFFAEGGEADSSEVSTEFRRLSEAKQQLSAFDRLKEHVKTRAQEIKEDPYWEFIGKYVNRKTPFGTNPVWFAPETGYLMYKQATGTAPAEESLKKAIKTRKGIDPGKGLEPIERADGGEANAEPTAEELERASRAAFGVYPSSGRGRQQGSLSRAVQSGEALTEAAKGATMLPYNLVGAPVDLATMAMRPFGYSVERPVMGSEWLKERARSAGVAFPEPQDPALRGFYTAGDIASNVVNPAGATRAAARGAGKVAKAAKETGERVAQDPAVAGAVERAVGRAAPVAAPMYAVRPRGGGISALDPTKDLSQLDSWEAASNLERYIAKGVKDIPSIVGINSSDTKDAIRDFWKIKGVNYVTRQMGTPDDPILSLIMQGKVTGPRLRQDFMQHTVDSAQIGKTRVNPQTGETRFFPKYPDAIEALTRTYDDQLNVHPFLFTRDASTKGMSTADFHTFAGPLQGQRQDQTLDQLISQGVSPERANVVKPAVYGFPRSADELEYMYSGNFTSSPAPKSVYRGNVPGGETDLAGKDVEKLSSEALRRAVIEGETIYDFSHKGSVKQLLDPQNINEYLATLSPKEIIKLRFEDAVKDSAKYNLRKFENEMLADNIRLGKRVPEKFFEQGVSMPLLQVQDGPLAGFAFKRIEKPEATTAEGAWVGHSVGGYAQGGAYGPEAHRRFLDGKVEVYSLRDNRNRPVTTIEVKIGDDGSKKVSQIKGNGKFTGNTAPVNYDAPVLQFLQDYLKPAQITESDTYLTPLLQSYKNALK